MEKYYQENSLMKNIYITNSHLMASDEDYGTPEAFLEKINAEKKAMLDTHVKIEYGDILKLVIYRKEVSGKEDGIQIFYTTNGKQDRAYLQFSQQSDFAEVLDHILAKRPDMTKGEEESKSKGILVKPILYTIAAMLFSFALIFIASDIEQGEAVSASGRRKGIKLIFISIAETLGFWGSVAVGVGVTVGFIVYTCKVYTQSAGQSKEVYVND